MTSHALLELRNVITLLWFIVTSVLVLLFGWYLYKEAQSEKHWWKKLPNQLALPLFVHFLGGEIVRVCLLAIQIFHREGSSWGWALLVLGGGLSIFGAMGVVYVLAPRKAWQIVTGIMLLIVVVVFLIYNTSLIGFLTG